MAGFSVTRRGLSDDASRQKSVTASPAGGAAATTPTVLLDTYYDAAAVGGKSAAIQAAYVAAAASKAVLECQAGRVYSLDTAPLKLNPATPIVIEGRGATFQANWAKPRCVDFTRTADYQTFNDIDVRDLTFDANGQTSVVNQSVVGTIIDGGGVNQQRVNANRVYLRRCRWKNVPVGPTGGVSYACFSLQSLHQGAGETQTNLTDIHVEGAYMRGGNIGAQVQGTCSVGGTVVEVYHDKIYLEVDHDSGVTPTANSSVANGNVQIGSLGFGDYCEVRCIGANSNDVGVEIDAMQTSHVWGRITDSWNSEYLARNFHAASDPATQTVTYHATEARIASLSPNGAAGGLGIGYQIGGTSTPNPTFGHAILEGRCKFSSAQADVGTVNGQALQVPNCGVLSVSGQLHAVMDKIVATTAGSPHVVYMVPSTNPFRSKLDVYIKFAGSSAAAAINQQLVYLSTQSGGLHIFDLDLVLEGGLTGAGISNASTTALFIGANASTGTMRGRVRRYSIPAWSGDATPSLIRVQASSTVAIDGSIVFEDLDWRALPAGAYINSPWAGAISSAPDATNRAKMFFGRLHAPTFPWAAAAMSATWFTSGTFTTATGNQYTGGVPAIITMTGGAGITLVDRSVDNTNWTNVWTQASGVLSQTVQFPVQPGEFVRVTFATTQPTTTVTPITQ